MDCLIRKVQQGDEFDLAYIQTESWKAAFKDILSAEILQMSTNLNRATAMYKRLLDENIGNGYILEVDSHPHCIAWWDTARDNDMPDYAELICIHSLQDNWRKGFGTQMMSRVMGDMRAAGYDKVMLLMLVVSMLASSIPLPFIFKLGVEKGRTAYYVMIGFVCGASVLATSFFRSQLGIEIKPNLVLAILAVVGVGAYALSWRMAITFYKKREIQ